MLSRQRRMTSRIDWQALHSRGTAVHGRLVVLKYRRTHDQKTRFGFIVGTKVSKKAIERNRVKRRLRYIIASSGHDYRQGYDVALIARPTARTATFTAVQSDVLSALQKAHIAKKTTS